MPLDDAISELEMIKCHFSWKDSFAPKFAQLVSWSDDGDRATGDRATDPMMVNPDFQQSSSFSMQHPRLIPLLNFHGAS
jgi:hypothetical protein